MNEECMQSYENETPTRAACGGLWCEYIYPSPRLWHTRIIQYVRWWSNEVCLRYSFRREVFFFLFFFFSRKGSCFSGYWLSIRGRGSGRPLSFRSKTHFAHFARSIAKSLRFQDDRWKKICTRFALHTMLLPLHVGNVSKAQFAIRFVDIRILRLLDSLIREIVVTPRSPRRLCQIIISRARTSTFFGIRSSQRIFFQPGAIYDCDPKTPTDALCSIRFVGPISRSSIVRGIVPNGSVELWSIVSSFLCLFQLDFLTCELLAKRYSRHFTWKFSREHPV